MYEIIFSNKARKHLKKLDKNLQKRIISTLERVRIRPESYLTKLVGDPGYKLRVGEYRLIIDVNKRILTILILKVGHRKNIYKG
ncbi:MAG: type II toxin-antitoxin system RelE/ParE family toxin [Nanoarchaeota archaeon]|nr:type II toxin-antitoxin system RelE/ParE family toxin [Nanoarchaeota archaeon]